MPWVSRDQIVVEKTPGYIYNARAPERVRLLDEEMKLIVMLRDPVSRLVSGYTMDYRRDMTNLTFDEAVLTKDVSEGHATYMHFI